MHNYTRRILFHAHAVCDNRQFWECDEVSKHLLKKGSRPLYLSWYMHGEPYPKQTGEISVASEEETMIETMVMDAAGPYFNWYTPEESPNAKAKAFYDMLGQISRCKNRVQRRKHYILWEAHSIVSRCSMFNSEIRFENERRLRMLSIKKSMLPLYEELPQNYYQAKKKVRGLGMEYKKIYACPNDCMLYYKPEDLLINVTFAENLDIK